MVLEPDLRHEPLQRGMPALLPCGGRAADRDGWRRPSSYEEPPPPPRWAPARRRAAPPPAFAPAPPPAPDGATNDEVELILADRPRPRAQVDRGVRRPRAGVAPRAAQRRSPHDRSRAQLGPRPRRGDALAARAPRWDRGAAPARHCPCPAARAGRSGGGSDAGRADAGGRRAGRGRAGAARAARAGTPATSRGSRARARSSRGAASDRGSAERGRLGRGCRCSPPRTARSCSRSRRSRASRADARAGRRRPRGRRREAGVEAYAQGEAKLRLRLSEPVDPRRLAAALGEQLGVEVRVAAASHRDRVLQLAFE